MAKYEAKAVNVLGETKDPIKSLWRNVLIVALEDAIGRGFYSYGRFYQKRFMEYARNYFLEPNADFKSVCTFAGFDHEYVRMKAKKYFKEKANDKKSYLQSMQW